MNQSIRDYLAAIGRKGGQTVTPARRAANAKKAKKAALARWGKVKQSKSPDPPAR